MSQDILIKPLQLRSTAQTLRELTRQLRIALETTDRSISGLGDMQFAGSRASTLRSKYLKQRSKILGAPNIVLSFANEMEQVASIFEKADRSITEGKTTEKSPTGDEVGSLSSKRIGDLADGHRSTTKSDETGDLADGHRSTTKRDETGDLADSHHSSTKSDEMGNLADSHHGTTKSDETGNLADGHHSTIKSNEMGNLADSHHGTTKSDETGNLADGHHSTIKSNEIGG